MNKLLTVFILFISMILVSGCNHDVFIDGPEFPNELDVTIMGDHGNWSRQISLTSLRHISLSGSYGSSEYLTYYDKKDNISESDIPASELDKIVYDSPLATYSITLHDGVLGLNSLCNASNGPIKFTVCLEYDYVTKYIHLEIEKGTPLEILDVVYDNNISWEENIKTETHSASFTNNGPILQYFNFKPFSNSVAVVRIVPIENWLDGFCVDMPVLTYSGLNWIFSYTEGMIIGEDKRINSINDSDMYTFEVPANEKLIVSCSLSYTRASDHGIIKLQNSVTGQQYDVEFFCESEYPVNHEIKISYE